MSAVRINDISNYLTDTFDGLAPTETWGELSFFYNPEKRLPRGTYFCTIKEKDGDNDKGSNLNRDGVYRMNFGLPPKVFEDVFGPRPARPAKSQTIEGPWDFTALNMLMPHPVYGWMGWVCLLSPEPVTFDEIKPLLTIAHKHSVKSFNRRIK